MAITFSSLPTLTATQGSAYSSGAVATGGTGPYTYTIPSGNLPAGLSLNASTGAVTGTPTISAVYTFLIVATDSLTATGGAITSITVSGGSAPPVGNPVAAHTFDFVHVYLSTRTSGAPGSGGWTVSQKLFDGTSAPTNFSDLTTFSAGALTANLSENRGIVGATDNNTNSDLTFLGNGSPDAPVRISFTGQHGGRTGNGEGYWNTTQGAWLVGSNYYIALSNQDSITGFNAVTIIKSTDSGATWAIQDQTNGATGLGTAGTRAAIQRIDNYLFVFTAIGGGDFQLFPFNMATGLWETPSVSVNIPNLLSFGKNAGGGSEYWSNGVIKFLNGDFLVLYNTSTPKPIARMLVGGIGGAWGAEITLPGNSNANSIIDTALNLAWVFTYSTANVYSQVHCSSLTQGGTFTSDVALIPACVATNSDGVGHCSIQNSLLFVPRDDAADFDNSIWVSTLPVTSFSKEFLPIPAGEANQINGASPNGTGTGYIVGDTGTINGGATGFLATYHITAVSTNVISTYSWASPHLGAGYAIGDTGTVDTGGTLAHYQILSVDGGGAVLDLVLTSLGSGYSTGLKTTTPTSGGGSGLEISVDSVFNGVSGISIDSAGGGYSLGVAATTSGGSQPGTGTGLTINITAVTGKTPSCAYMMFPNGYSLTPPSGTCTITVTAGSGPCDNVVPVPATDVQFKLIKCIATLKPETHLPVRGSVK